VIQRRRGTVCRLIPKPVLSQHHASADSYALAIAVTVEVARNTGHAL
jgi:hypothetical protein